MPNVCAIAERKNVSRKDSDLTFHSFPRSNLSLCKVWTAACKRKDKGFNFKTARICSEHFPDEAYNTDWKDELMGLPPRKKLRLDAVPTVFTFWECKNSLSIREGQRAKIRGQSTIQTQHDKDILELPGIYCFTYMKIKVNELNFMIIRLWLN